MAENSKIEWCDHTVNLWWGCSKVHTGCKNCYAEYLSDTRYKNNLWGANSDRKRIKSAFNDLDRYQKEAAEKGITYRIFIGSMMDIFEEDKKLINPSTVFNTGSLRWHLFNKIKNGNYNNLVFLFLTKRPENIGFFIPVEWFDGKNVISKPNNVWFGTSISNQETANIYTNRLRVYAPLNLFLSIEPQVGDIYGLDLRGIKWVIQGGESGHNKRPFDIQWAYSMKEHCANNNVPYFFKQIDKVQPIPDDLKIQQFPKF
jgi:protein gp37